MRQLAFCFLLLLVAGPARAADWVQIYSGYAAHVDMASVRRDKYPKYEKAPEYTVAWMRTDEADTTVFLEVVFDCEGRFGVVQQIVNNETKDSRFHSYNNTQYFESRRAETSTIMPHAIYDGAASMVCKGKAPLP
jgi:hypothetical protein